MKFESLQRKLPKADSLLHYWVEKLGLLKLITIFLSPVDEEACEYFLKHYDPKSKQLRLPGRTITITAEVMGDVIGIQPMKDGFVPLDKVLTAPDEWISKFAGEMKAYKVHDGWRLARLLPAHRQKHDDLSLKKKCEVLSRLVLFKYDSTYFANGAAQAINHIDSGCPVDWATYVLRSFLREIKRLQKSQNESKSASARKSVKTCVGPLISEFVRRKCPEALRSPPALRDEVECPPVAAQQQPVSADAVATLAAAEKNDEKPLPALRTFEESVEKEDEQQRPCSLEADAAKTTAASTSVENLVLSMSEAAPWTPKPQDHFVEYDGYVTAAVSRFTQDESDLCNELSCSCAEYLHGLVHLDELPDVSTSAFSSFHVEEFSRGGMADCDPSPLRFTPTDPRFLWDGSLLDDDTFNAEKFSSSSWVG